MITSPFMETINYFLKFFNEKQDLKFYEMTKISTVPKHEYFDILAMVMNLISSSFMETINYFLWLFNEKEDLKFYEVIKIYTY